MIVIPTTSLIINNKRVCQSVSQCLIIICYLSIFFGRFIYFIHCIFMILSWICSFCFVFKAYTSVQKFGVSKIFLFIYFLKYTFIHQGHKHWSKVAVKTFLILQNIYISNICCSFERFIHQRSLKNKMYHSFHKNIWQHNCFQKCFLSSKSPY